jgi:homocitrate synthase
MCATCNAAESNGNTNGASANGTNGTNGTNGSSHDGHTLVKSSPAHKSPYAPVGDFLSNVSRFKIIGTSFRSRRALSELRTMRKLIVVYELAARRRQKALLTSPTESTLREGEQFANAYFDLEAKIKIARALDEFGVDCTSLFRGTLPADTNCFFRHRVDQSRCFRTVKTGL